MDRLNSSRLMRRIGIGAGVLLLILIAVAVTPPLIVRYRLHEFTGRLHAGMTAAQLRKTVLAMHLTATASSTADAMAFRIDEPWTFGSNCSSDYVVVVRLAGARVAGWRQIRESLCLKG